LTSAPILAQLTRDYGASFVFVDAPIESTAHPSIEGIFDGPFYSWVDPAGSVADAAEAVDEAIELLYEVIDEQGPFDAIIGFSQGAAIATVFMLHHMIKHPLDPPYALFKYALLFSGAVFIDPSGIARGPDGKDPKLRIPSLHVCGEKDEVLKDSLALSTRFNKDSAEVFMHTLGHTIPKDSKTVSMIMNSIKRVQHKAVVM
jgi:predicted esterase